MKTPEVSIPVSLFEVAIQKLTPIQCKKLMAAIYSRATSSDMPVDLDPATEIILDMYDSHSASKSSRATMTSMARKAAAQARWSKHREDQEAIEVHEEVKMPPPEPSEPQKKKPTRFIPDDSFLEGSPVKDAFLLFIQYRKKIRKTLNTQMSYQNCHKNLMKLSGGDPDKAFEIVNNSISNGYQGIFPLKDQDNGPSTKFERQARAQQQLISSVSQQCADRIRAEQTSREGSGEGGFVPPEI